jgi:S-adenosylmethionine synthetase
LNEEYAMTEKIFETAEFVLPGHPDKLCDAVVDSVVDAVRRQDPEGQCGLEAACVFDRLFLTGRIAASREVLEGLDVDALARQAYASAGYGVDAAGYAWGPLPENLRIDTAFCWGEFEPGERELRHLSDDQAVCVGYANRLAETDHLPPAHWLARRIGRELHRLRRERGAGQVGPDAKVVVRVERDGWDWRPAHASVSLNHHAGSDWILLREIAEEAVETACAGRPLPDLELNGAGMFVSGGPNGDNGLSGKKLVVDAYGPTVPIGGGAWSGKDFRKVDRIGGLLARELALAVVTESGAGEARVTLEYIPGCDAPVHVGVLLDDRPAELDSLAVTRTLPRDNLNVWRRYVTVDVPLVELARWGHQQAGAPWEGDRPLQCAGP